MNVLIEITVVFRPMAIVVTVAVKMEVDKAVRRAVAVCECGNPADGRCVRYP